MSYTRQDVIKLLDAAENVYRKIEFGSPPAQFQPDLGKAIRNIKENMENVYLVEVSVEVPVVAKNETDARTIALFNAENEIKSSGTAVVKHITKIDSPDGFRGTIPWGDVKERTVEEILGK